MTQNAMRGSLARNASWNGGSARSAQSRILGAVLQRIGAGNLDIVGCRTCHRSRSRRLRRRLRISGSARRRLPWRGRRTRCSPRAAPTICLRSFRATRRLAASNRACTPALVPLADARAAVADVLQACLERHRGIEAAPPPDPEIRTPSLGNFIDRRGQPQSRRLDVDLEMTGQRCVACADLAARPAAAAPRSAISASGRTG